MISAKDVAIVDIGPEDLISAERHAEAIAGSTMDTWQPDRPEEEKLRDTRFGKIAERAFEGFASHELGLPLATWDEIRDDDYREHAPLDGFIASAEAGSVFAGEAFEEAARKAQRRTHFEEGFLRQYEELGVFGYEVKSTRITGRLRSQGKVDIGKILGDDFLQYPARTRSGFLSSQLRRTLVSRDDRRATEKITPYFLVRVYMQRRTPGDAYTAYLIGYITRDEFLRSSHLTAKRMPQPGKSQRAIYYAVPLRYGHPIESLPSAVRRATR